MEALLSLFGGLIGKRLCTTSLGPADGELAFREKKVRQVADVNGRATEIEIPIEEPYLIEPDGDRFIYRTGDGHNHGTIYTILFKEDRVEKVVISAGY